MKKLLLTTLLWSALSLTSTANVDVPAWVVEFSNLAKEQRDEFTALFNAAKVAYQRQAWSVCMNKLTACENIFANNPNVNVLRVGCLQEMGLYEQALKLVLAHLKQQPNDLIAKYNLSSLYLAMLEYQKCIDVTEPLLRDISMQDDIKYRDLLNYRLFICKLALHDEAGAAAIVANRSILDDSPLYYMSQAAIELYRGNREKAAENLKAAQRIYGKTMNMPAYELCLKKSGLVSSWDIAL